MSSSLDSGCGALPEGGGAGCDCEGAEDKVLEGRECGEVASAASAASRAAVDEVEVVWAPTAAGTLVVRDCECSALDNERLVDVGVEAGAKRDEVVDDEEARLEAADVVEVDAACVVPSGPTPVALTASSSGGRDLEADLCVSSDTALVTLVTPLCRLQRSAAAVAQERVCVHTEWRP